MSENFQIAIDGPSGAGKSTIAKKLSEALQIVYIDTGAMYRAVGYKILQEGVDLEDKAKLESMLDKTEIDFQEGDTILDGQIVGEAIRSHEISKIASDASAIPEVRQKLVAIQQAMGKSKNIILDGRDIGTNVFPNARYKYFLTASVEERARRRWNELKYKGQEIDFETVKEDIAERDRNDSTRALNPLKKAQDAIEIDTTNMSIAQVVQFILDNMSNK